MTRIEGWEDRLIEVVSWHASIPFSWGRSDCFTFPMDVVAALTGDDPWASERDYDSELGAARKLRTRGFKTTIDAFAAKFEEVHPAYAHRGDIGIADYPSAGLGGGVVVLGTDVIGKGLDGTVRLPRDRLVRAFKVGW